LAGAWCKQSDNNKKKIANEKTESYVQLLSNHGNYRNADCNKQTYQLCAKNPKKFMREKFAGKNS
jgi:hypothetical protein